MSTTLDLIRAIDSGNSRLSQSTFEELVQTRVASAIDARRTEIAQSMFVSIDEAYDPKNPKIDLFHNGEYIASTKWSPTVKHAVERIKEKRPELTGTVTGKKSLKESQEDFSDSQFIVEKDEGKHNNGKTTGFDVVAKKAAEEYGSEEAGKRVAGAIRKKILAKEDIDAMNEEEFNELVENYEQLDELSKNTLARYVKDASKDVGYNMYRGGQRSGIHADEELTKVLSKAKSRRAGISKAVDKLTK